MQIEYCGWNEEDGAFHCYVYIDENKQDYEIHYKNGMIAKQCSPFENRTADWNNDGDIYTQFGAWFSCIDKNGESAGRDFWTPVDMVSVLVDAKKKPLSKIYGNEVIDIPDIKIPILDVKRSLEDLEADLDKKITSAESLLTSRTGETDHMVSKETKETREPGADRS